MTRFITYINAIPYDANESEAKTVKYTLFPPNTCSPECGTYREASNKNKKSDHIFETLGRLIVNTFSLQQKFSLNEIN